MCGQVGQAGHGVPEYFEEAKGSVEKDYIKSNLSAVFLVQRQETRTSIYLMQAMQVAGLIQLHQE